MASKRARGVSKPLFNTAELKGSKRRQEALKAPVSITSTGEQWTSAQFATYMQAIYKRDELRARFRMTLKRLSMPRRLTWKLAMRSARLLEPNR
jgi:hypothetical protein